MSVFSIDLTGVDWLYVAQLYAVIFFSNLTVTLALMFAATLVFWVRYPNDLRFWTSAE
jgi:hypothetical protein